MELIDFWLSLVGLKPKKREVKKQAAEDAVMKADTWFQKMWGTRSLKDQRLAWKRHVERRGFK